MIEGGFFLELNFTYTLWIGIVPHPSLFQLGWRTGSGCRVKAKRHILIL